VDRPTVQWFCVAYNGRGYAGVRNKYSSNTLAVCRSLSND